MKNYKIVFWPTKDDKSETLKISEAEYNGIKRVMNEVKLIEVRGQIYAVSDIKRIIEIKQELMSLPPPAEKPISPEFMEKFKRKVLINPS